ncbi:FAD-binding domain-containing protein [Massarina eburnea CBS 473.64]|uniref:FAD-binding domain-containing protein n=1 Tax=Massarina eburnea CBS 473.64 TaxID=1395130 RepID=A0A6A6RSV8_9PLEO|nr:FAD-binding domain-containing protein [Massarina eburnea CBS 473.64]
MLPLLLLYLLAAKVAWADTCSSVEALGYINVKRSLDRAYFEEQTQYWSTSCSALLPSCIIFPNSANEVSTVLKILANTTERFAVKSGGHNPNNYFSSVDGGPLIATEHLDQASLNQATGVVDVGPGNRLDGIAAKLQGSGWTFVGGRIGNTGVGGLVLGGGLSYMSAQYGWAASQVLEYEIVFANGTIGHITKDYPDLFKALKGGGNNFGIVTNYKLQAHPQANIWGGNLVYLRTPKQDKKLLKAVRDFTEYNTDPKAAVIVTAEKTNVNIVDSWIIFLFYDGPKPPIGIFANFTAANPLLDTTREQTYADLMAGSNWVVLKGEVIDIATETIPLPSAKNEEKVMESIHAHWRNISDTAMLEAGIVASIAWQPFPKAIAREARKRGPDLIDVDESVDRIIIEMNYAFTALPSYEKMADTMEATYSGVRNRVVGWQKDGTLPKAYLPVFMNYGFYRQDYFGRLRPQSRALAKSVSEAVDPDGLFRTRTGGWRP